MDYRIIAANATIGQIQVTYSNSGTNIASYAIDVPVVRGAFLTGTALEAGCEGANLPQQPEPGPTTRT